MVSDVGRAALVEDILTRRSDFFELAREVLSSTERGYNLLANKFDVTPFRTPDPLIENALAIIGQVDNAIDICCGTGAGIRGLRARCHRHAVGVEDARGGSTADWGDAR